MNGEEEMARSIGRVWLSFALACLGTSAVGAERFSEPLADLTPTQQKYRVEAAKGDYQAMRNLAFSYASAAKTRPGSGHAIAACSWYLLIPAVHRSTFQEGDVGNVYVYCNKLSPAELTIAYDYAFRRLAAPTPSR